MPSNKDPAQPKNNKNKKRRGTSDSRIVSSKLCSKGESFSSVQLLSCVRLFATPWTAARQASLSIRNSWRMLTFTVHQVGDAIQPSHPLSSSSPPAFNHGIRVFFSESALCIRWTEYWSFSFSISSSKVISPKVSDYDLFSFLLPGSENKLWKLILWPS